MNAVDQMRQELSIKQQKEQEVLETEIAAIQANCQHQFQPVEEITDNVTWFYAIQDDGHEGQEPTVPWQCTKCDLIEERSLDTCPKCGAPNQFRGQYSIDDWICALHGDGRPELQRSDLPSCVSDGDLRHFHWIRMWVCRCGHITLLGDNTFYLK